MLSCPSLSPRVCSNLSQLNQCHPTISSSVSPFSSCPQSFPASESFLMSQLLSSASKYWSFSISPSNEDYCFLAVGGRSQAQRQVLSWSSKLWMDPGSKGTGIPEGERLGGVEDEIGTCYSYTWGESLVPTWRLHSKHPILQEWFLQPISLGCWEVLSHTQAPHWLVRVSLALLKGTIHPHSCLLKKGLL